ncbi:hypothetical protein CEXT_737611 [Caerostris extrusa]|uniref:Immunoglobulin V-set domain-containing protein n=1 Tax=Caerostris extrusa TaxID=172846 RepID=A0AAV4PUR5_CAEEX|nr:hypothetical protein CEXT_737611 [Caerostris extrusa]
MRVPNILGPLIPDYSLHSLSTIATGVKSSTISLCKIHAEPAEGDQVGLRLVFTNVEMEDAGTYTCSDDQDSVSFDLTVYRKFIL